MFRFNCILIQIKCVVIGHNIVQSWVIFMYNYKMNFCAILCFVPGQCLHITYITYTHYFWKRCSWFGVIRKLNITIDAFRFFRRIFWSQVLLVQCIFFTGSNIVDHFVAGYSLSDRITVETTTTENEYMILWCFMF